VQLGNHNDPWFRRDKNWDSPRNADYQSILEEVPDHWESYPRVPT